MPWIATTDADAAALPWTLSAPAAVPVASSMEAWLVMPYTAPPVSSGSGLLMAASII